MPLTRDLGAPKSARRAIAKLLGRRDADLAHSVESVTSELVSNVVQHSAAGDGSLRVWDADGEHAVRVEVQDGDHEMPSSPESADERGGRGLLIVDELSDGWGVDPIPHDGKVVWADFDVEQPSPPGASDTDA